MTAVTIDQIQAKQTELASMIAQLLTPSAQNTTIQIAEASIELEPGEHYAGAVLGADGQHVHHLVLMAAKTEDDLTWQAALEWADKVGGALPTRQEQALLFANCKPHLQPCWHWSCEAHENASDAWDCNFYSGDQNNILKNFKNNTIAVRRV